MTEPSTDNCPPAEDIAAFVDGAINSELRKLLIAHFDKCSLCYETLTGTLELQKEFPNIVGYKMADTETKVAAGWLIDNAGLKGYRKGDAGVHKNQALVLVNYNNASGQDIINLSELVQEVILEKYGISIEAEVNFI